MRSAFGHTEKQAYVDPQIAARKMVEESMARGRAHLASIRMGYATDPWSPARVAAVQATARRLNQAAIEIEKKKFATTGKL